MSHSDLAQRFEAMAAALEGWARTYRVPAAELLAHAWLHLARATDPDRCTASTLAYYSARRCWSDKGRRDALETYGQLDSAYGMHPCKIQLPGVESSTGSLGHGLALSVGLALAARQRGDQHRVFCLMGDGETCEGTVWEAANTAGSFELGNLVVVIDRNRQLMSSLEGDAIHLEPYPDKWRAFNFDVVEVDGHDLEQICDALDALPPVGRHHPTAIIAHTVKGRGVSFMERNVKWHAGSLTVEQMEAGLAEIEAALTELGGAS